MGDDWSAKNPIRPPVAERAKKSREALEDLLTHDLRRVEGKIPGRAAVGRGQEK